MKKIRVKNKKMSGADWSNLLIDQDLASGLDQLTKPIDNRGVEAYRNQ